jgi:diguanylate cyclase (GGDEF)-like protein
MYSEGRGKNLIDAGIRTAELLASSQDMTMNVERAGKYLYEQLRGYTDRIRLYVSDEKGENFHEEVICTGVDIRMGSDIVPLYQLPKTVTRDRQVSWLYDNIAAYLLVPLIHNNRLIGLLEIRVVRDTDDDIVGDMALMAEAISLGLNHAILMQETIQVKQYYEAVERIVNHIQAINNIEVLLSDFVSLAVSELKLDRATVFIYERDGNSVAYNRCSDSAGTVRQLDEIPGLPVLGNKPEPMKHLSGYWFPLMTGTRTIGAALFDNIYSSHPIPERLTDILMSLCNQFAATFESIRLFTDMQKAARYDKLTGIYNRAFFEEELQRLDTEIQLPLSIILGDVNGLKITNDVFGHFEGDNILKSAAAIMSRACRPGDIIARWGGDEFIILLPTTPEKEVDEICEKIRAACVDNSNTKMQLSISLGHATRTSTEEDIRQVLKNAEDRMYRHKLLENKSFRSSFVSSLKETLFEKCQETSEHIERMEQLSVIIGTAIGLTDNELDELKLLAMLHDIGKVAISDRVLNKPGKLVGAEWEEMKMHSEIGFRIAQASSELSQIADYILCHHERWDGTGYPLGRKGPGIPRLSRIISIIDAYDVMTHVRSYKTAMPHREAIEELVRCSGTQFDPFIVDIFVKLFGGNQRLPELSAMA